MKSVHRLLTLPLRAFGAPARLVAGPPAGYEFSRADPRARRDGLTDDLEETQAGDRGAVIAAMKPVLWPITVPFLAFEILAGLIVAPPADEKLSRDGARRERDLQIEALRNTPPPPMA